jgi:predicted RND superfamily exporter protein
MSIFTSYTTHLKLATYAVVLAAIIFTVFYIQHLRASNEKLTLTAKNWQVTYESLEKSANACSNETARLKIEGDSAQKAMLEQQQAAAQALLYVKRHYASNINKITRATAKINDKNNSDCKVSIAETKKDLQ